MAKRILGFALSLMVMAGFYVFSVMMQGDNSQPQAENTAAASQPALRQITPLQSGDPEALYTAFNAPFPLPVGLVSGSVENSAFQTSYARVLRLVGSQAQVTGVRPATAAPLIFPKEAAFVSSSRTLLGFELLEARQADATLYALVTDQAAFLIVPSGPEGPGEFHLQEKK